MSVKKAHSKASNPPAKRTQSTDASMSDSTESPDNLQVKSSNDSKVVFEYDQSVALNIFILRMDQILEFCKGFSDYIDFNPGYFKGHLRYVWIPTHFILYCNRDGIFE